MCDLALSGPDTSRPSNFPYVNVICWDDTVAQGPRVSFGVSLSLCVN